MWKWVHCPSLAHGPLLNEAVRICSRALMLLILCTVRGVYTILEQPSTSVMDYFPAFKTVADRIRKHLQKDVWKTQFLPLPQSLR